MIGTRQMERVLSHARDAGAKVVLVGDPEQLQAIEAGAAFRRHRATRPRSPRFAGSARTGSGRRARWRPAHRRGDPRLWRQGHGPRGRHARAGAGRAGRRLGSCAPGRAGKIPVILTHTNAEVQSLNGEARDRLRASGDLGDDVAFSADGARVRAATA
jgi:hypothetical protein